MKKYLLVVLFGLCLVVSACSNKGTVKDDEISPDSPKQEIDVESDDFAKEPSVRDQEFDTRAGLSIIFFGFDSSSLSGANLDTLKANATYLKNNPKVNVVIEGHCDERGTTEYNLALGQKRALKVKEYYVQLGISPNRIATVSYGEEMPLDKRNNEAGWAKNRRAETKVLINK